MIDGGVSISGAIVLVLARERRSWYYSLCVRRVATSVVVSALSIFLVVLPHPVDVAVGSEKTGESGKVT